MPLSAMRVPVVLCVLGLCALSSAQVNLGAAKSYGVLGRLSVTNTGPTTISGDLGTGGTSITGQASITVSGNTVIGEGANAAFSDASTAYNLVTGFGPGQDISGGDLGGQILPPGIYRFTSSAQLTGTLVLNGTGSPDDAWYFQIASSLTTAGAVLLSGGGKACNVYWAVGSSATLGTATSFIGTILASDSVTFVTGTVLNGRAFGLSAEVTLDSNTISVPDCAGSSSSSSIVLGTFTPLAENPTSAALVPTAIGSAVLPVMSTFTSSALENDSPPSAIVAPTALPQSSIGGGFPPGISTPIAISSIPVLNPQATSDEPIQLPRISTLISSAANLVLEIGLTSTFPMATSTERSVSPVDSIQEIIVPKPNPPSSGSTSSEIRSATSVTPSAESSSAADLSSYSASADLINSSASTSSNTTFSTGSTSSMESSSTASFSSSSASAYLISSASTSSSTNSSTAISTLPMEISSELTETLIEAYSLVSASKKLSITSSVVAMESSVLNSTASPSKNYTIDYIASNAVSTILSARRLEFTATVSIVSAVESLSSNGLETPCLQVIPIAKYPGINVVTMIRTVISTLTFCPHKATCAGQTSVWTGSEGPLPCSAHSTCSCVLPGGPKPFSTEVVVVAELSTLTSCPHKKTCTGQTSAVQKDQRLALRSLAAHA
ncbi:hypothetical protein B2J93_39 [Marssonina coronariae]|uniref:Uncharacterized protein n=1 Tax=Diplocarpon coronariae TaxID=2795749 RepID=A0A218Z4L3_9HELO|nr:hypothetical protein B2J93_39 [Marssonina coronariae]